MLSLLSDEYRGKIQGLRIGGHMADFNEIKTGLMNGHPVSTTFAQVGTNQTDIVLVNTTVDGHTVRLATTDTDLEVLQGSVLTNASDIVINQGGVSTNQANITSLQGSVSTNQVDIKSLQGSVGLNSNNITTLNNNVVSNDTEIASLQGSVSTNQSNITSLQGSVATNQLNINNNTGGIASNSQAIAGRLLNSSSTSIQMDSPQFIINGGDNDCTLILHADTNNSDENKNPRIILKQDGGVQTGAVFLGNNHLNLSSSATGSAGILFRTSTTNGGWENAPVRMTIGTNGDVVLENSIRIKSINELEFGFGDPTKNQFSGRCSYKGFSLFALDLVGAAVGAADRQVQIYEDLTLKAVIQTSDERLKQNIRPIEIKMAGELIDNLQPKCFMWKNIDRLTGEEREFTDHHCYMGLIAQEVKTTQDTIGDAMGEKLRISRNPKNEKDFMSVSYTQLIAPMMKCIQDLRTRVKLLEERLE